MSLFKSKKFWMAVAGVGTVIVTHYYDVPADRLMEIAGIFIAYLLGQGLADHGKEAARVDSEAAQRPADSAAAEKIAD